MLSTRVTRSVAAFAGLGLIVAMTACSSSDKTSSPAGVGGSTGSSNDRGGSTAAGGSSSTGGSSSSGEVTSAVGGAATSTGNSAIGGSSASKGSAATGGASAVKGSSATGGAISSSSVAAAGYSPCATTPAEEGFVDVPVEDPGIRYVGRVFKRTGVVEYAFPAVQIQTVFEGDAIDMRLVDNGSKTASLANYYWIIVDDVATKLQVCPAREVYPLARNLGPGQHSLTIVKRTESGPAGQVNSGKGEFRGFRVRPGTTLQPVTPPSRRMEFVGDSITCGYGNEVSTTEPDNYKFTTPNEDGWNAYGAITARALKADYVAVAASGRGVIRNYSGFDGSLMPEIYEQTMHEDSRGKPWDHSQYLAHVVVVNLGTNDFSPGIELDQYEAFRASFTQGYIDFLTRIREVHQEASIVAVVGPMLGDDYPTGYKAWTSIQADVKAAVDARAAAGDADVHYFALAPQESPYGEDWHPTIATHQKMADSLAPFIAGIRGW